MTTPIQHDRQTPSVTVAKKAQNVLKAAWEKNGALVSSTNQQEFGQQVASSANTVNDTVSLSEGGQKIVNLNRGHDLAAQIRKAPNDENFSALLRRASQDVFRITRLFGESLKTAFGPRR